MRKIIILISFVFSAHIVQAQLYVGMNAGYGIGVNGRSLAEYLLVDANNGLETVLSDKRISFGGGMKLGTFIGYKLNKNIGLELGINYHRTNKASAAFIEEGTPYRTDINMKGQFISFLPCVIGYIYDDNSLNVYSKIGAVFQRGSFQFQYESLSSSTSLFSYMLDGGNSMGLNVALGAQRELKNKLSLRMELSYLSANYYPGNAELTKNEEDGINILPTTNLDTRYITYSRIGNTDGEFYGSAFRSRTAVSPQIPMNGFGFNVGLVYGFSKKDSEE